MRTLKTSLGVLMVLLMVGVPPAWATQVRYTLTARIDSTYDRQWSRGEVEPPYFGWETWHETTALAARSTRPFTITRSADGRTFRFTASMTGGLSHAATGTQYDWGALAIDDTPELNSCLTTQGRWSAAGAGVRGHVSLSGASGAAIDANHVLVRSSGKDPIAWTLDRACRSGYTYRVRSDAPPRTPLGWNVRADQLRKRFGRAFTITSDYNVSAMDVGGRMRNRMVLRFVPVEQAKAEERRERQRWQVDVLGTDQWRWGVLTNLGAGVDVDWRHRTTLELEDDRIVSAMGKVSIRRVRPHSQPPGVFTVTAPTPKTRPEYALPSATKPKGSRIVTLITYDRRRLSHSEYVLRYTIRFTGPQALGIIRQAGLPDPDVLYGRLIQRERLGDPVIDSVAPFVPDPARLVFVLREGRPQRRTFDLDRRATCPKQLSDQVCFTSRGGQIVTVTRLR